MDWLNEPWFEIPAFISLAALAFAALRWMWRNVIKPGWVLMKAAVHLSEIHNVVNESLPILKELNQQFQPNHGTSIHDHITRLDRRQERMDEKIDGIAQSIDRHVIGVQAGGRRASDPE